MRQFRLSTIATRDIERLYEDGLGAFGLSDADRYYEGLFATFDFLATYPRAARLREEIHPPVRAYRYRSHLIVYDLDSEDTVTVLRVRHGREDWLTDMSEY